MREESGSPFIRREGTEIKRPVDAFFEMAPGRDAESSARNTGGLYVFGRSVDDPVNIGALLEEQNLGAEAMEEPVTKDEFIAAFKSLERLNSEGKFQGDRTRQRALHEAAQKVKRQMIAVLRDQIFEEGSLTIEDAKKEIGIAIGALEYYEYPPLMTGLKAAVEKRTMSPN